MNRDDADRALTTLGAARDRVAATMYAIDSHPALGFLRAGGLDGATRKAWASAEPLVDAAWTDFAALGDGLEQAREIRAERRPADAEWATMERSLTVVIPAIAARLETGCTGLVAWLGETGTAIDAADAAVAPITTAMTKLTARAGELGDTRGIAPLDRRVTLAADAALRDPLTAAPGGTLTPAVRAEVTTLAADIATASGRLDAQARIRDGYPQRVAALGSSVDALAAAEIGAGEAFARALEKIADPGLPDRPAAAAVLRARISSLDALHSARDWRRLADDATTIEASIAGALERALALAEAADGLIERRTELRGRLDAYRAKAARHRLDEDATLSPLHMTARELLYTAPCDLAAATRAVFAYQRALTEMLKESDR